MNLEQIIEELYTELKKLREKVERIEKILEVLAEVSRKGRCLYRLAILDVVREKGSVVIKIEFMCSLTNERCTYSTTTCPHLRKHT